MQTQYGAFCLFIESIDFIGLLRFRCSRVPCTPSRALHRLFSALRRLPKRTYLMICHLHDRVNFGTFDITEGSRVCNAQYKRFSRGQQSWACPTHGGAHESNVGSHFESRELPPFSNILHQ